jgi:hypothetical protein
MKVVVRTIALSLAITGIAAGAYSKNVSTGNQVATSATPVPNCPLNDPGCGIWK